MSKNEILVDSAELFDNNKPKMYKCLIKKFKVSQNKKYH